MHVDKPRMEYTRRGIAGGEDGASNQTDRSSCFRSGTKPSHLLAFASPSSSSSWSLGERERQSIPGEAGGGEAGEKEREPRARQRWRESEREERRKRGGRVAPHILLISVSIVVSVGTPSLRARGAAKGWRGTIHHLVFRFAHVPPPLHLPPHCCSRAGRFRSLAFAASMILENTRDNDVVSVEMEKIGKIKTDKCIEIYYANFIISTFKIAQ